MDRHQEDPFHCAVEAGTDRVVLRPFGELDCWTVPAVEKHLLEVRAAGAGHVELDLAGLSFLDSSAVALVVRWMNISAEDGFLLRVCAGSPQVRRIFELTSITHLLADGVATGQLL